MGIHGKKSLMDKNLQSEPDHIRELYKKIDRLEEFVLNRLGRPYYPLCNGWGLTHLDTGHPFFVNTKDHQITPWILMGGHWETNVDRALMAIVKPGMFALDIGANMGYYTVKLGAAVGPSGRVVSFEPTPESAAFVRENISINAFGGYVDFHQVALGAEPGLAKLSYDSGTPGNASLKHRDQGSTEFEIEVPVDTVDRIIGSRQVDLIKLDAEGFEPNILAGAQTVLRNSPNCSIIIELSRHRWELIRPLDDIYDMLGHPKRQFAVMPDGRLSEISRHEMRNFLDGCLLSENYIFFVPE